MTTFSDPATGGDKLPLAELEGSLLLVSPLEQMAEMQTSFGPATPIRANVAVLDGTKKGDVFDDALIFPRVLQGQLRPNIGGLVLGRLGKGQAKAGQSAPWTLATPTDADRETATKYVAYVESQKAEQDAAW